MGNYGVFRLLEENVVTGLVAKDLRNDESPPPPYALGVRYRNRKIVFKLPPPFGEKEGEMGYHWRSLV